MKLNSCLVKSTVVAALGGLLFGFDTAVIAGTTQALTKTFNLSPGGLGLTVASALMGTILGAMLAGIPGERWGRPRQPAPHGGPLRRFRTRMRLRLGLVLARVLPVSSGGLGIGGSSVLGPMYIAEIARGQVAGPPGGLLSVQRRLRHPARLLLQLSDRPGGPRRRRVALETRRRRASPRRCSSCCCS